MTFWCTDCKESEDAYGSCACTRGRHRGTPFDGMPTTDEEIEAFEKEHGPFDAMPEEEIERLTKATLARLHPKREGLYVSETVRRYVALQREHKALKSRHAALVRAARRLASHELIAELRNAINETRSLLGDEPEETGGGA